MAELREFVLQFAVFQGFAKAAEVEFLLDEKNRRSCRRMCHEAPLMSAFQRYKQPFVIADGLRFTKATIDRMTNRAISVRLSRVRRIASGLPDASIIIV